MDEKNKIQCIGFIMDGNRRFAKEKGWSELVGHKKGKDKFLEVIEWLKEMKIPNAVFYAFSTENWRRDKEEVEHLMMMFREVLTQIEQESFKNKFKVRIVGNRKDLPLDIQQKIAELEKIQIKDESQDTTTIWIALSYGGRAEILQAVNQAVSRGEEITEEEFAELLWTKGMPDPDLVIRTSGEKRLSNFLPWQTVYSELFFTDTYWPAFTKEEFTSILNQYANRERRVGR